MLPAFPGRWPRRGLYALAALVGLVVAGLALLQLPPVATWLGRRLLALAPLAPDVRLGVGRVSGSWLGGVALHDVVVERGGRRLAVIRTVRAGYDPRRLLGNDRRLGELVVEGATIHTRREAGSWDIATLLETSDDTAAAGGSFGIDRLILRDVGVVAELAPDSVARVADLELRARNLALGEPPTLTIDRLSGRITPPTLPHVWLAFTARGAATADVFRLDTLSLRGERTRIAGHLVLPRRLDDDRIVDQLDLRLAAAPLALADLAPVLPMLAREGELTLDLRATADGRRARGRVSGRLGDGRLAFDGTTLLGPDVPAEYSIRGEVRGLDPSRLAAAAPAGLINADVVAELRGVGLDSAGGRAELRMADSRVGGTELRELRLTADLVSGRADLDLRTDLSPGSVKANGWARPFDSVPSYRLAGTATGIQGTDRLASRLAGAEGSPRLEVGFRVSGRGVAPDSADASGRATLTAVRRDGARSSLGHATLELAGGRLRLRPELLVAGGRIAADVTGRMSDPVTYRLRGGVIHAVNLGRLLGDTVAAPVSGRFALDGQGTAPAEAKVRATVALDEIRYGARRLDDVAAEITLDRGRAALSLRGGLQGGRLGLAAEGRPFDSTAAFTIRRAALDSVDLGTLLGRADLAGPFTAKLTGRGRWGDAAREFSGRLEIAPSRLGEIAVDRGDARLDLAAGRLRYDGSLTTSAGALALAGDGRPLDAVPSIAVRRGRADSLDLGALLGRAGLATRLDARFAAEAAGTAPDSMRARLSLDLLPSRINQARLRGGRAVMALDRGALQGDVRVDGEDGDLVTTLRGATAGPERRLRAEGAIRLDRLARWTGDTERDGYATAKFTLEGAADSAGLLALAGTVTANGALDSVRLDTLQIALSPEPGALRVDTVVVRSNVAAFDGGGRLALREGAGTDTLRLAGMVRDPMPLMALAGSDSLSLDSATVRFTATGPAGRRRISGAGAAHRLLYAGNQVEHLTLAGTAELDSAGFAGAEGEVSLEGGALGQVVVREARLAGRYDSLIALEASALLRDSIAIGASLRGTARGDTVRGTLERLDLSEGGRRWSLERPASFAVEPPRFALEQFALRSAESRLAVHGVLDRAGANDLAVELRRFDLEPLRQVGLAPFGGVAEGTLRVTGPADDPSLAAGLRTTIRREDGSDLGQAGGKVRWTRAGLALEADASQGSGGRLTVAGTLPLRLTLAPADTAATVGITRQAGDTLGLVVRADSFELGFFEPFLPAGSAEKLAGRLLVDGRVSGTMERPRVEGTLAVREFAATLPALNVRYERGELLGRLAEDRLALERLHLVSDNDGELTVTGSLRLTPLTDPALALDAVLRKFRVSHSATLRTIASGRLRLEGTAAVPVMTGALTLGRTDIITGTETAAAANVEKVELTAADLQQLAREFGPSVLARSAEGPGLVDRFRLDLDVRLPRRIWFRQRGNMKSDIEISGRVRVRQEPGQPMGFFGEVEPMPGRGFLELYGRQFRVLQGEIALAGPAESVVLDVTAQYQVTTQADPGDDGILIDVNATGRADSLKLAFSSEPTMSEEDIVSYIVTGRPASENPLAREEAGGGPGAAEAGAEVALGRLSESVAGAAGEALGLDVFQIRQDGLRGLTLTAGRYIASRVFLSLQQPIQLSSSAQSSAGSTLGPGFELEYSARRWLRANLRAGNLPPRFFLRGRHAF